MKKLMVVFLAVIFLCAAIISCKKTNSIPFEGASIKGTVIDTPAVKGALLDDMEDGDNANKWGAYWYTYDDLGDSGSSYVFPHSDAWCDANSLPRETFAMATPGNDETGGTPDAAARMTGFVTTQFMYGFVGMGTGFKDPKGPVDLSGCTGIRFWQKGDGKEYRMKISSSHPKFLSGVGDNFYGFKFTSSNTVWTKHDILLTALTQEVGWGSVVTIPEAMSMATDLQFQTVGQPIASIDLWIDDVEIYGCPTYEF